MTEGCLRLSWGRLRPILNYKNFVLQLQAKNSCENKPRTMKQRK
jgi:hypothetical protein